MNFISVTPIMLRQRSLLYNACFFLCSPDVLLNPRGGQWKREVETLWFPSCIFMDSFQTLQLFSWMDFLKEPSNAAHLELWVMGFNAISVANRIIFKGMRLALPAQKPLNLFFFFKPFCYFITEGLCHADISCGNYELISFCN